MKVVRKTTIDDHLAHVEGGGNYYCDLGAVVGEGKFGIAVNGMDGKQVRLPIGMLPKMATQFTKFYETYKAEEAAFNAPRSEGAA